MSTEAWADLSKVLFWPTTVLLYFTGMLGYLYANANRMGRQDEVDDDGTVRSAAGRRALVTATALTSLGFAAHIGHVVTRSIAAGGRVPWGNMFEFSSVGALIVVGAGLFVFQWRLKRPDVLGFLLIAALLTIGAASVLWTEPGPLVPILNSGWLWIHVATIMLGFAILTLGFVFNGLYLLRETAERRVAQRYDGRAIVAGGRSVGAAYAGDLTLDAVDGRDIPDADPDGSGPDQPGYGDALRAAINPLWLGVGSAVVGLAAGAVFINENPRATILLPFLAAGASLIAWRFLPSLPTAATLDGLAYRTIAFAFPIWTFAIIAGAIWAEQSWGRYWGWDPKETSAFLTWVAYAAYLHARATRGMKGRNAAIVGLAGFGILYFTYFVVNLFVTGLHSYGGLS